MKILILAVNYNTYDLLDQYLVSIEKSLNHKVKVEIAIADNTPKNNKQNIDIDRKIPILLFDFNDNPGYMGSLIRLWTQEYYSRREEFDYVIMSNVDLKIDECFWNQLQKISYPQLAWIAPDVITERNHNHENPFMRRRPSLKRMYFYKSIYINVVVYNLYVIISRLFRPKRKKKINLKQMDIYAGHGSIFILTKEFLEDMNEIHFDPYMYGEEIFFAELVRTKKMKVLFEPALKVYNIGKSAGKIRGNKWKCKVSRVAVRFLIDRFWK